jgi:hypothetical protein
MRDANAQLLNLPRGVMGDAAGPSMNRQSADASTTVDRLSSLAFRVAYLATINPPTITSPALSDRNDVHARSAIHSFPCADPWSAGLWSPRLLQMRGNTRPCRSP